MIWPGRPWDRSWRISVAWMEYRHRPRVGRGRERDGDQRPGLGRLLADVRRHGPDLHRPAGRGAAARADQERVRDHGRRRLRLGDLGILPDLCALPGPRGLPGRSVGPAPDVCPGGGLVVAGGGGDRDRAQPRSVDRVPGVAGRGRVVQLAGGAAGHGADLTAVRSEPGQRHLQLGRGHRRGDHTGRRHVSGRETRLAFLVRGDRLGGVRVGRRLAVPGTR